MSHRLRGGRHAAYIFERSSEALQRSQPPGTVPARCAGRRGGSAGRTPPQSRGGPAEYGANLYRSIGVRPLINAKGTFTIITGSETLPEVKRAMDDASRAYVQMDELMDGVGKRLAELTGAEWGIITDGCCAALTHTTAASLAGSDPERMQHLPNLEGLKSEVVIPAYSRNVYDHAIRMLGVKIVTVHDPSQLEAAFNERTALAYILGGPGDDGPMGTKVVAEIAKRHNVPVIVDAAAEILTIPNVHLQRGATAVAYSGGKCIRGPQAAGSCWAKRTCFRQPGPTARPTTPSAARSRSAKRRSWACWRRWKCG